MVYILRLLNLNNQIQIGENGMKMLKVFAMALAIVAFLPPAFNARAQTTTPNQQNANGTATVVLNQTGPANGSLNGEYGGGSGNGNYTVTDPVNASGNAAATGTATGSSTGPIVSTDGTTVTASGNAKSVVSTLASGTGANTNISTSAGANQGSWSGTTADVNATTFANASQSTYGGGNGTGIGNGTVSQNANGTASGENSASTINVGGLNLNVTSTFKTDGLSSGTITATTTDPTATQKVYAVVSGGFAANGASLAGDPSSGTSADSFGNGGATYYATSPTGSTVQGAGEVSGQTNAVVGTNTPNQTSVSVSSVVASKAQAK
jgi:hypothetical protein